MTDDELIRMMRTLQRYGVTNFVVNDAFEQRLRRVVICDGWDMKIGDIIRQPEEPRMCFRGRLVLRESDIEQLPYEIRRHDPPHKLIGAETFRLEC